MILIRNTKRCKVIVYFCVLRTIKFRVKLKRLKQKPADVS